MKLTFNTVAFAEGNIWNAETTYGSQLSVFGGKDPAKFTTLSVSLVILLKLEDNWNSQVPDMQGGCSDCADIRPSAVVGTCSCSEQNGMLRIPATLYKLYRPPIVSIETRAAAQVTSANESHGIMIN